MHGSSPSTSQRAGAQVHSSGAGTRSAKDAGAAPQQASPGSGQELGATLSSAPEQVVESSSKQGSLAAERVQEATRSLSGTTESLRREVVARVHDHVIAPVLDQTTGSVQRLDAAVGMLVGGVRGRLTGQLQHPLFGPSSGSATAPAVTAQHRAVRAAEAAVPTTAVVPVGSSPRSVASMTGRVAPAATTPAAAWYGGVDDVAVTPHTSKSGGTDEQPAQSPSPSPSYPVPSAPTATSVGQGGGLASPAMFAPRVVERIASITQSQRSVFSMTGCDLPRPGSRPD
ncbi:MAG: hypothetical protein ACRDPH_08020 [Marmoricola sp.]